MHDKLQGIVLNTIKYSDKNSIVHIYTDKRGRVSFLLPQGSGKIARMRNALFMPLSLIEFDAVINHGRDLHTLRDVSSLYSFSSIYIDPVKNAIVMFITELLGKAIQSNELNSGLFRYVSSCAQLLDKMENGTSNFHICFLYNLGAFLGIQPDVDTYQENYWFDMLNGEFTVDAPPHNHALPPHEAKVIVLLSRMNFSNLQHFVFNRTQRNFILEIMLNYYQLHNSMLGLLKSPEILKQLFQ